MPPNKMGRFNDARRHAPAQLYQDHVPGHENATAKEAESADCHQKSEKYVHVLIHTFSPGIIHSK